MPLHVHVVGFVKNGHSHHPTAGQFRVSVKFVNDTVILKREQAGLKRRRRAMLAVMANSAR